MVEARYVFVNKTAESSILSQSLGQERRQIMSHVQRSGPHAPGSFVSRTVEDYVTTGAPREKRAEGPSRRRRARLLTVAAVPRPLFAPFHELSLPTTVDTDMCRMLDYYITDVVATIFPVPSIATQARRHLVECVGEDPAVLHALLGVANASVYALSHNDRYSRDSDRCQYEALGHIRRRLQRGPTIDAGTAFAVAQLLRIQCGQGDLETVRIHYDGLVHMVDILTANIPRIPFPLLLGVQACIHPCAATLQTKPPAIAFATGKEREFDETLRRLLPMEGSRLRGTHMPCFFFGPESQSVKDFVGEALFEVMSMSHHWRRVRDRNIEESRELSSGQSAALAHQPVSLEYRLLSLPHCSPSPDPLTSAREAVRLALYLLSVPPVPISEPRNAHRTSLARQLKTALEQSDILGLWRPCTGLLLLVLAVAAQISYGQDEWTWLVPQFVFVCEALGIRDCSALRETLEHLGLPLDRLAGLPEKIWPSMQNT